MPGEMPEQHQLEGGGGGGGGFSPGTHLDAGMQSNRDKRKFTFSRHIGNQSRHKSCL